MTMFETDAATARETEYISPDEQGATSEVLGEGDPLAGLFPDTPPVERPVPQPQAHRGEITGVTIGTGKESGTQFLQFAYRSLDTGGEDNLAVFPPQEYIDNVQVDPNTLSDEPGPVNETTGKPTQSIRAKYAYSVRNSKGNGTIEQIVNWAIKQGHRPTRPDVPRTFTQLADFLNGLVTGTNVIALLRAQGGDGEFSDRLRTRSFGDYEQKDNTRFFKNYRKLWTE